MVFRAVIPGRWGLARSYCSVKMLYQGAETLLSRRVASTSTLGVGCDASFVRSLSLQNRKRKDFRDVHAAKGSYRA